MESKKEKGTNRDFKKREKMLKEKHKPSVKNSEDRKSKKRNMFLLKNEPLNLNLVKQSYM